MNTEQALKDCEFALERLKISEQENNTQAVKLDWLTCLTLLRAIGHISENEFKSKRQTKELFKNKKSEAIFNDFIKLERDSLLKEYVYYLTEKSAIRNEPIYITTENGDCIVTENGDRLILEEEKKVSVNYSKGEGFGTGRALSSIITEGIEWWEDYISKVKNSS